VTNPPQAALIVQLSRLDQHPTQQSWDAPTDALPIHRGVIQLRN
jgi:hypothetical protein